MDFLTRVSLKRPVATMLALLALVVFGISSIFTFELELIPDISLPIIMVYTTYEGANAETVDKLVATPIEEFGSKMQGVYSVESTTGTGYTSISFQFDYGTDMDQTFMDFKSEIELLNLPEGCQRPTIRRMKSNKPFVNIQVTSGKEGDVLTYVNNTVKPRLERVPGVAQVNIYGGKEEYIRILLNETLMDQYSVTVDSIRSALASTDYNIPANSIRQGSMDIRLSSTSSLASVGELEALPIQTGTGAIVSLRDVADVSYAVRKADSISRHNGSENIRIAMTKNQTVSTVTAARNVEAEVKRLQEEDSDVMLTITMNSADEIMAALKEVGSTLIIGILLSMLTLFLFFGDLKASLIVGSSMPISLLATLIIMAFTGTQLNMLTLAGLVIAIGMMVDSSIVVLESCFRAQERGLDFKESALQGTKEVTASIIASTITTCVVYLPMAVMSGLISSMFQGLCMTIVYAMITSLLVSLTFIPLFFMFYKPTEKKNAPAVHIMQKIAARYAKGIRKIIRRRAAVVLITLGMVAVTALMAFSMNTQLETPVDQGEIQMSIKSRVGTAMEIADENARKYEEVLLNDPDIKDIDYSVEGNEATITAYIKDIEKTPTSEKVEYYNILWADEKGVDMTIEAEDGTSTGSGSGAKITLTGDDYEELKQMVYKAMEPLAEIDGVFSVSSQLESGAPEAKIHIDPKKAMDAGLNPQNVALTIANVNNGIQAMKLKTEGEEYKVRLEYPEGRYDDLHKIMNLKFTGQGGRVVPLSDIAELKYEEAVDAIIKSNGQYSLDISMVTSEDDKFRVQEEAENIVKNLDFGTTTSVGKSALEQFFEDELKKMVWAIAASIFLVFLAMAMQFESPRFSAMVMMSIPFSLIGSIGLTFVTGGSLNGDGALGILMLAGIVVNDGILFVDTTNTLKEEYVIEEALARSGEIRLRPILMTTLTTVLSMLPLLFVKDSSASMVSGMGLIIIGGLMASTMLILFLLPTFYMIFMGKKAKIENYSRFNPDYQVSAGRDTEDRKSKKKHKKSSQKKKTEENTSEKNDQN